MKVQRVRPLLGHELIHVKQQENTSEFELQSPMKRQNLEIEALRFERNVLNNETGIENRKGNPSVNVERQHTPSHARSDQAVKNPPVKNRVIDTPMMAADENRVIPTDPELEKKLKPSTESNSSKLSQQFLYNLKLNIQTERERTGG